MKYETALRAYQGDPATLPNLPPRLAQLAGQLAPEQAAAPRPMTRTQRLALSVGALAGVACLGLACFYSIFTYNLLPVAFPPAAITATTTPTATLTAVPSATATATAIATATATPVPTTTAAPTSTSAPTATAVIPPSATPAPALAVAIGNVWARETPSLQATPLLVIERGTPLVVRAAFGDWLEVEWQTVNGTQRGWARAQWVSVNAPLPASIITPTP